MLTLALGAPEAHRLNLSMTRWSLQVKQKVDIWSMGCVLSEVVTWACQGWNKIRLYRQDRADEIEDRTGQREDRFHRDEQLLQTTQQIHDDNKDNVRRHDKFTSTILDGLVNEMMQIEAKARPDAAQVYSKAIRILRDIFRSSNGSFSGDNKSPRGTTPMKRPPHLPPHRRRQESSGSFQSHPSPLSITNEYMTGSPPSFQGPLSSESAYGCEPSYATSFQQPRAQTTMNGPEPSVDSPRDLHQGPIPHWSRQGQASQAFSGSHQVIPNHVGDAVEDPFIDRRSPRKAETRQFPLEGITNSAQNPGRMTLDPDANAREIVGVGPSNRASVAAGKRPIPNNEGPDPIENEMRGSRDRKPPPELLFRDALELSSKGLPLPDKDRWLEELEGRDHVSLVGALCPQADWILGLHY